MSRRYIPFDRPHAELLEESVNALLAVRRHVHDLLKDRTAFERASYTSSDGKAKVMLQVDKEAENICARLLVKRFGEDNVRVLGEEALWKFKDLDLSTQHVEGYGDRVRVVAGGETRLTAIVDMIDGSDLIERDFGNWCSALVFFLPSDHPQILFSLVHHADGSIYGADEMGAFLIPVGAQKDAPLIPLKGPEVRELDGAYKRTTLDSAVQIAICYYGQKHSHFATLPAELLEWAQNNAARDRLRFYNLGGNPMMCRLANGENVHAVFEHVGQFPHDAVPGAYIAMKAGAILAELSGQIFDADALASYLMMPSGARIRYALAGTEELAIELAMLLGSGKMFFVCRNHCGEAGKVSLRNSDPPHCDTCNLPMIPYDRRGRAA